MKLELEYDDDNPYFQSVWQSRLVLIVDISKYGGCYINRDGIEDNIFKIIIGRWNDYQSEWDIRYPNRFPKNIRQIVLKDFKEKVRQILFDYNNECNKHTYNYYEPLGYFIRIKDSHIREYKKNVKRLYEDSISSPEQIMQRRINDYIEIGKKIFENFEQLGFLSSYEKDVECFLDIYNKKSQ